MHLMQGSVWATGIITILFNKWIKTAMPATRILMEIIKYKKPVPPTVMASHNRWSFVDIICFSYISWAWATPYQISVLECIALH